MKSTAIHWLYPGARWWKFDFHTHTPASTDYGKGPDQEALRRISPENWLLGYMRAEIDCVAVTDHNSGAWIDRLTAALKTLEGDKHPEFRPLQLFPGVEITANGGVHVLAILDPAKTSTDVAQLLGAVDFHGTRGASEAAANAAPIKVAEAIAQAGALPILAHVDGPSGAFEVLKGSTLAPLIDSPHLFAMEVCDSALAKPELYRQRKLAWAEVLGSDSHHPGGSGGQRYPGSHFTWVKMGSPSLEGLRLALLDGNDVSIRRSDVAAPEFDPFATPDHFIESIEITNAKFMGRASPEHVEFTPWFNALVGGRGTGKSTIAHFVRLAYRRESELAALGDIDSVAKTFERFNHIPRSRDDYGGLGGENNPTEVRLTLMRDGVRYRLNWRQNGVGPVVEEQDDEGWRAPSSQAVTPERFPARMFSQGQIAGLATEGSHALLDLIDLAVRASEEKEAIREEERRFLALRASIRDFAGKLAGREALSIQLADIRRKLDRFEKAHHAEVLKAYQQRTRQERELLKQFESGDEAANRIEELAKDIAPDDVPPDLFDPADGADRTAMDLMQRLGAQLRQTAQELRAAAKRLRDAVGSERMALPATAWHSELEGAKKRYAELIAALKSQAVTDLSEYGKLVQDRQRLEGDLARLDSLEKQRAQVVVQAENSLKNLAVARRRLSEKRDGFLRQVLAHNSYVRIALEPYGRDLRAIERSFREVVGVSDDRFGDDILVDEDNQPAKGAIAALIGGLPADAERAQAQVEERIGGLKQSIAESCEGLGKLNFGGHFANYLERELKRRPEFLDRVLVWYPEDSLRLEYSPKGDGAGFRPIKQASDGQRAAAMLAFLLTHGTEPIVLDQPEDDLDNHLIYDLVVQQIRSRKQHRQIIAITHNPNIVVNGDAEMIHALEFRNGQCRVVERGCLQEKVMRDEICRVMEGGREAFERRFRRLGKD